MFATLTLPLLVALVSVSSHPAHDPYAIYRAAIEHLATLEQPPYIIDTQHWVVQLTYAGGGNDTEVWDERRVFNSATRRECVLNIPFDMVGKKPQIGESYFAPDSWLISHTNAPVSTANAQSLRPDLSDLRIIASVVSIAKPSYDIRLVGIDAFTQGRSAYHLALRPRSNPMVHNLRELWIDTQSDDILRATIEGEYRPDYDMMVADTFVTEDFGRVGEYWLVIHHRWAYAVPLSSRRYYYDATSSAMQFPERLPEWFFDAKAFPRHYGEVTAIVGGP